MQSMPSLLDRRRLKDRIVESVSKAVKQIQEYQFNSGQNGAVLTNHDWQLCKLVEHLDHAFLHGLRHITNGYWVVVQDFTHKATTKEIKRMTNVTTNLGRGRAWLYLALMDHLLESYLHCFMSNLSTVKRYYAKEALVLDQQRMEILLTLASGLEFITFQLDIDVPYLDLCSHVRPRLPSQEDSLDRISLCSMESSMSQSSSVADFDSFGHITEEKRPVLNGFFNEDEENTDPQRPAHMTTSASMPLISSGWDGSSRMERVNNMPTSNSFDHSVGSTDLEVIHVKSKSNRTKKSRRMKKRSDSDFDPDRMSLTSLTSVSSETSLTKKKLEIPTSPQEVEEVAEDLIDGLETQVEISKQSDQCMESTITNDTEINKVVEITEKTDSPVQDIPCIKQQIQFETFTQSIIKWEVVTENENEKCAIFEDDPTPDIYKSAEEDLVIIDTSDKQNDANVDSDREAPINLHLESNPTDNRTMEKMSLKNPDCAENGESNASKEEVNKEISSDVEKDSPKELVNIEAEERAQVVPGEASSPSDTESEDKHPSELKVDINYLLLLKLHVLQDDEEQLLKMYRTSLGHTEGETQPVYILISSLALYILSPTTIEENLNVIAELPYNEIDYILLGVGDQIITIVCTNRRRQFWITTGDEQLTRHIVSHIDRAVRLSQHELPHLSVLTEPSHQRIALRKWAAKESKLEVTETIIYTYILVHWCELPSMDHVSLSSTPRKEGMLLVRTSTSILSTPSWKPYYFVLKDGMLYQYADKYSGTPPKACIQLSGEDCAGCRRSPQSDRPHSFELILSDESILQMSAKDAEDTQDWLLSLCQAVAEGTQNRNAGGECLASCCVVTQNKLLICHEDIQTNFFRTLGAANVTDVTGVLTDPLIYTYLVIAFETREASVTSGYWTLYFNAKGERNRFMESLSQAWIKHFKVTLPVSELSNVAMVKHCREGQARLQSGSL